MRSSKATCCTRYTQTYTVHDHRFNGFPSKQNCHLFTSFVLTACRPEMLGSVANHVPAAWPLVLVQPCLHHGSFHDPLHYSMPLPCKKRHGMPSLINTTCRHPAYAPPPPMARSDDTGRHFIVPDRRGYREHGASTAYCARQVPLPLSCWVVNDT